MEFEEEENLTVYIEELKSDDCNLKLNAIISNLQTKLISDEHVISSTYIFDF